MATKKVKIKVTKKKVNIKRIILVLLALILVIFWIIYFIHRPLKNIYVSGNSIVPDKDILELSKLSDYPPYINTYFMNIESNLLKNDYIKNVGIKRKIPSKIYIHVEEYKPIAIYKDNLIIK